MTGKSRGEVMEITSKQLKAMSSILCDLDYCPRIFGFTDKTITGNCPIQKGHGPYPGECEQCWEHSIQGGYEGTLSQEQLNRLKELVNKE